MKMGEEELNGIPVTDKLTENDIYGEWDPMAVASNHFLNYDPDALCGIEELKIEDTPCKFYSSKSKSDVCRRQGCRYKHDKRLALAMETHDFKLGTPLVQREVIMTHDLNHKTKAPCGIINAGVVVSALDPSHFYIIPHTDWICACKLSYIGEKLPEFWEEKIEASHFRAKSFEEPNDNRNTGVSNLSALSEDLKVLDRVRLLDRKVNSYCKNQVVAVEIFNGKNESNWYRAIVTEDVILGENETSSTVPLRLLDYGTFTTAGMRDVVPLPEMLLRYPPLVYKCALNGVNPISHRWSKRATHLFADLVEGKECIFEVTRKSSTDMDVGVFEVIPYLVELSVLVNGHYLNLSEKLIAEGLGLEWNPFPTLPDILTNVSDSRAVGLFMSKDPCLVSRLSHKKENNVINSEVIQQKIQLKELTLKPSVSTISREKRNNQKQNWWENAEETLEQNIPLTAPKMKPPVRHSYQDHPMASKTKGTVLPRVGQQQFCRQEPISKILVKDSPSYYKPPLASKNTEPNSSDQTSIKVTPMQGKKKQKIKWKPLP